ncbi:MAG: 50S ribosomal protein L17 [Dehalococcoidia bacterium]|nr:50S ribosomal protein L17 [Dehalococcoidia bacterium]
MAGRKLSRPTSQRMAMYYSLATDLLRYGRITTTEAKAKETRRVAEKIVTMGKNGRLSARRRALAVIRDEEVVGKVFDEFASRYSDRRGGYTRVIKLGRRSGDGASMAILEMVE